MSVWMCVRGPSWVRAEHNDRAGVRRRVCPTFRRVTEWLAELPAPVAVAYEAGACEAADQSTDCDCGEKDQDARLTHCRVPPGTPNRWRTETTRLC